MIIHVKKRDNPYAQIDKRALNDDRLSWKARGLLSYLLSKPPDWQVWVRDLVNRSQKDGETAVRSALKELKDNGYVEEKQPRREDGTFGPVEYWVYEEPLGGFPQADNPQADEPKAEKPHSENQGHTNNDSTDNEHTDNEGNKEQPNFPENPKAPAPPPDGSADSGNGGNTDDDRGHTRHSIMGDAGAAAGDPDHPVGDHPMGIDSDFDAGTEKIWEFSRQAEANQAEAGAWSVPAQAGGSDDFRDGPVDAFCEVLAGFSPRKLPKEKRESWGDKLREIAKEWSTDEMTVTPAVMEAAISAIPDDGNTGWRSFSSPYSDNFDKHIGPLLLNDGKPRQKGAKHGPHQAVRDDRRGGRTPEQWRDPVPT